MLRDRDGQRLWVQSEDGTFEPVQSHAGLLERQRGQGVPDWWVVAKDPDWTPPTGAGGHMKPNSSGQMQPYDTLGQYASPRGSGWTGTSGQGQGRSRTRGTSLLSMGGGVLEEDAPEQPGPRRNQDRRESLLFMDLNGEAEERGEISESEVWGKARKNPLLKNNESPGSDADIGTAPTVQPTFKTVQLPGLSKNTLLVDEFAERLQIFHELNRQEGIDVLYESAFRTTADQQRVASEQGAITPAPPGASLHEAGLAVDIKWKLLPSDQHDRVVANAKRAGLSWGGDWTKPDRVHFYLDLPKNAEERRRSINRAQREWERQNR